MKSLEIKQDNEGGWWVKDPYNGQYPEYGPYSNKKDALEIKKGLARLYRLNPEMRVENEFSNIPQPDPDNWEYVVDRIEPNWKPKKKRK